MRGPEFAVGPDREAIMIHVPNDMQEFVGSGGARDHLPHLTHPGTGIAGIRDDQQGGRDARQIVDRAGIAGKRAPRTEPGTRRQAAAEAAFAAIVEIGPAGPIAPDRPIIRVDAKIGERRIGARAIDDHIPADFGSALALRLDQRARLDIEPAGSIELRRAVAHEEISRVMA